jgi:hypothetical protein
MMIFAQRIFSVDKRVKIVSRFEMCVFLHIERRRSTLCCTSTKRTREKRKEDVKTGCEKRCENRCADIKTKLK